MNAAAAAQKDTRVDNPTLDAIVETMRDEGTFKTFLLNHIADVPTAGLVSEMQERINSDEVQEFIQESLGDGYSFPEEETDIGEFDDHVVAAEFADRVDHGSHEALDVIERYNERAVASVNSLPAYPAVNVAQCRNTQNDLTVPAGALRWALEAIAPLIQSRNTIPVLGCVRFNVRGDVLVIMGTDLDTEIAVKLPFEDLRPEGERPEIDFCIEPRPVLAIARDLAVDHPEQGIILTWDAEKKMGGIGWLGGEITVPGQFGADFPTFAPLENSVETVLDDSAIEALDRVRPFISTEETRYYLNGVAFSREVEGAPRFVATDGHRMRIEPVALPLEMTDGNPIIPRAYVDQWRRVFRGAPHVLRLWKQHTESFQAVSVHTDRIVMYGKLIDGSFPEWPRVAKLAGLTERGEPGAVMKMGREPLKHALQTILASGISPERSKSVRLTTPCEGVVHVTTVNPDRGSIELPVRADSSWTEPVGYNAHYLLQALATVQGEYVTLTGTPTGPALFVGDKCDGRTILMPLRV